MFRKYMSKRWFGLLLLACMPLWANAETIYSFAIVPQFEPVKLAAIWMPILKELEKRTGLQFKMVGPSRIPEFETEFELGRYDFAYMNPYHVLMANDTQHYQPIVRDGSRKLFGIVVTANVSPINDLNDLQGKTIAFPAPNSLGASLMVRADLARNHVDFQTMWAQTHTSAYLNAALGVVDAAGGVMSTLQQESQSLRDKLKIIYETQRISPHPVVAHPRVDPADREKVR